MELVYEFSSICQWSFYDAIRVAIIVFSLKGMNTTDLEEKYLPIEADFECSLSTHVDMARQLDVGSALEFLTDVNAHAACKAFEALAQGELIKAIAK